MNILAYLRHKVSFSGLELLARTEKGSLKNIHYNLTWNHFRDLAKEALESEDGAHIYAKRKIDIEPVLGRMKGVFGVRRVHVRDQQCLETERGFLLMSMNLTKLAKKLVRNQKKDKNHRQVSKIVDTSA